MDAAKDDSEQHKDAVYMDEGAAGHHRNDGNARGLSVLSAYHIVAKAFRFHRDIRARQYAHCGRAADGETQRPVHCAVGDTEETLQESDIWRLPLLIHYYNIMKGHE